MAEPVPLPLPSGPPGKEPTSQPLPQPLPPETPSTGEELADPVARYRVLIERFDDDYEPTVGRLIRQSLLLLAYLAPVIVACFVGLELGDAFAGTEWTTFFSIGMHLACLVAELLTGGLVLGCMHLLRRVHSEPGLAPLLAASLAVLVVLCSCSSLALWWLLSLKDSTIPGPVVASRVLLPPLIDTASLLTITALNSQSLARYLLALQRKEEAIRQLAEAELRMREAEQAARNRQREYEEYREMRQRNEEILLQMLEIQSRGALTVLERQVRELAERGPSQPPVRERDLSPLSLMPPARHPTRQ